MIRNAEKMLSYYIKLWYNKRINEVNDMHNTNDYTPNTEDLEQLSQRRMQEDAERQQYTERPRSQRILAWILLGIMVLGIFFYCYWQMTPLV